MAYENPDPFNLADFDETLPLGTESPVIIDDCLRQTRWFIKTGLALLLEDVGGEAQVKALSNLDTDAVVTDSIKDLNVTTGKLEDKAVTGAKLLSDPSDNSKRAVDTDHIKNSAITGDKIANQTIGAGKLSSGAVETDNLASDVLSADISGREKMASGFIQASHIDDGAVGLSAVENASLTTEKLATATANYILACNDEGTPMFLPVGGQLEAVYDAGPPEKIKLNVASPGSTLIVPTSTVVVRNSSGSGGDVTASTDTYDLRTGLATDFNPSQLVTVVSNHTICINTAGTFLVFLWAVGHKVGHHLLEVRDLNGDTLFTTSPSYAPSTGDFNDITTGSGLLTVADPNTNSAKFQLYHFHSVHSGASWGYRYTTPWDNKTITWLSCTIIKL